MSDRAEDERDVSRDRRAHARAELTGWFREFRDSDREKENLRSSFDGSDARSMRPLAMLGALIYAAFGLTDVLALGWGTVSMALVVGRLGVLAGAIGLILQVGRGVDPQRFAAWVTLLEAFAMAVFFGAAVARVGEAMTHQLSFALLTVALMLFLPNRLRYVLGLATVSLVAWVAFVMPGFELSVSEQVTQAAGLVTFVLVAAVSTRQLGEARRMEFAALTVELEANRRLNWEMQRRIDLERELTRRANHDELTELLSRRSFFERSDGLFSKAREQAKPVAVMVLDVDHFKYVNDTYGHRRGDEVLRQVAGILRAEVGPGDLVGRIGGEEFAIILPSAPASLARHVAERIRNAIASHVMRHQDGEFSVTISTGVTECEPWRESVHDALGRADSAMYVAKRSGRNRVEFAEIA